MEGEDSFGEDVDKIRLEIERLYSGAPAGTASGIAKAYLSGILDVLIDLEMAFSARVQMNDFLRCGLSVMMTNGF
jgi:hypothetical protein